MTDKTKEIKAIHESFNHRKHMRACGLNIELDDKLESQHLEKEVHTAAIAFDKYIEENAHWMTLESLTDGKEKSEEFEYMWFKSYPVSFWESKKFVEYSKTMNKAGATNLTFGSEILGQEQKEFLDVLFNYGQNLAIHEVSYQLLEGAKAGDPRAVKMYLEMKQILNADKSQEELAAAIPRIQLMIGNNK